MGNLCGGGSKSNRETVFSTIPDQFNTLEELQVALRQSGLESSNLILGSFNSELHFLFSTNLSVI